ncbi:hypothetical protein MNEG_7216 [Monoraphidium neglectum]|uniref:SWIM-type domain-containing protein n=1 Tax=Monoraphidium neglectum TaxID=145388 RepID=A0A0D2KZZ2_9CHLO|nr:hypothetical protein MNEG_7216 [Monoraphidium neglectum]KIZ00744.1 hypothetical protein MNEG_7216 [Monoraphidium neglectum]|eukprot:XP_013899763.1 hypothetical protein MNEG_7216 [Monoraphidium neglectum]
MPTVPQLSLLLGRNWSKALQLVDQGAVHCFQGDASGRRVFQVHGKSGQHMTLPRHYCSCQAHHFECKHQLAARLAWILKACPVTPVDDGILANMLLEA